MTDDDSPDDDTGVKQMAKKMTAAQKNFAYHARNKTNTKIGKAAASTKKPKKR